MPYPLLMKSLDLFSLDLFVAVCDAKSILKVALAENVAASGISKRLENLSSMAGTPLLKRVKQGVEATPAGLIFAETAIKVLHNSNELLEQISGAQLGKLGTVHLAATPNFLAGQLIQDVANFLRLAANRLIMVKITECAEPRGVIQGLQDGLFSLGLIWDRIDTAGLQTLSYQATSFVAVVPKGHPLAQHASVSVSACSEFDIVATRETREIEAMLRRQGCFKDQVLRYRVEAWSAESAMRLIGSELGIGFLPRDVVEPYLGIFNLVSIPLSEPWSTRHARICFKDNPLASAASLLLANHLAGEAQNTSSASPRLL